MIKPDGVIDHGVNAFMTAIWQYMTPLDAKPSMHDVILGHYEPTSEEEENNICTGCFGTTINIRDGYESCSSAGGSDHAHELFKSYSEFCYAFGEDCPGIKNSDPLYAS